VKNSNRPLLKGVNFSTIVEICQSEPTNHTQDTAPVHTAFVLVLPQRQDALLLRDVALKDAQSLQLNKINALTVERLFYYSPLARL
jgi:hypothetical protein